MRRYVWICTLATTFATLLWLTPGTTLGGAQPGNGPRVVAFTLIEFLPQGEQHWYREPLRYSGCWSYERPAPDTDARPWGVRVRTADGVEQEFAVPDRAVTVCDGVAHLPAGTTAVGP